VIGVFMLLKKKTKEEPWNEIMIARALAIQTFQAKSLVMVPRCNWTGNECDLLIVTNDLRIIDVEIKISRQDFKADRKKEKWFHSWDWKIDGPWSNKRKRPRRLPSKIWKHYFAIPREVWSEDLIEFLPSKDCGVITLWKSERSDGLIVCNVVKRAIPSKTAEKISAQSAVAIARLASLRMWNAYHQLEQERNGNKNGN